MTSLAIEVISNKITEETNSKLLKNSLQCQNTIDQKRQKISALEAENQKLQ